MWQRGGNNENALGNLILHLCGNMRQWIGTGVAGRPDTRNRSRLKWKDLHLLRRQLDSNHRREGLI